MTGMGDPYRSKRERLLSEAATLLAQTTDRHELLAVAAEAVSGLAGPGPSGAAILIGSERSLQIAAAAGTLRPALGRIIDSASFPAGVRAALALSQAAQWPASPATIGLPVEPGPLREAMALIPITIGDSQVGLLMTAGAAVDLDAARPSFDVVVAQLGRALAVPATGAWMEAFVALTPDLVFLLEPDGGIRFANPAAEQTLGWEPGALVGVPWAALLDGAEAEAALGLLGDLVTARTTECSADVTLAHRRGGLVPVEVTMLGMLEAPAVKGLLVMARDARERRSLEAQLTHSAGHDPITNLPNRASLLNYIAGLETSGTPCVVLHVAVPDTLPADGHRRLIEYGERLRRSLPPWATLGRSDGEGFVVVAEGAAASPGIDSLADRILAALSDPLSPGARPQGIGVGLTTGRPDARAETLLREARLAAESARRGGSRHWTLFEPAMEAAAEEALVLRHSLANAVASSEFVLHYQPIVDARTGAIRGLEALLRWQHPDLGLLPPGRFITEAEDSGLIVPIGFWALEEACRALARFQQVDPSIYMSVNLSARQLEAAEVAGRVAAAVSRAGIEPSSLCLEITESLVVHPASVEAARIRALAVRGVSLAIDDFGTGFSSLGYLRTMPVDTVKIDRSFVSGVDQGGSQQALVASIVSLCQALDLHTVAEGVESEAEQAVMVGAGCDRLQGYLFSRPVPEAEAFGLVMASARVPSGGGPRAL